MTQLQALLDRAAELGVACYRSDTTAKIAKRIADYEASVAEANAKHAAVVARLHRAARRRYGPIRHGKQAWLPGIAHRLAWSAVSGPVAFRP